ncbi:MAG TPA: low affinity iron permease family protein [Candidatus Paceibacterota bacterium]|jgi:low affinity Fe/Cu permease|nr:low affinity iron permease family protein [Candidatus Paceibacterota bacterium]
MHEIFRKIAHSISEAVGTPLAFIIALLLIITWAVSGSYFHYSNTWQLMINTGTTILTFLMVFIIQNTQNRDSRAIHLKLDELIRASRPAKDKFVDLEDLPDEELERLQKEFEHLRARRRH